MYVCMFIACMRFNFFWFRVGGILIYCFPFIRTKNKKGFTCKIFAKLSNYKLEIYLKNSNGKLLS